MAADENRPRQQAFAGAGWRLLKMKLTGTVSSAGKGKMPRKRTPAAAQSSERPYAVKKAEHAQTAAESIKNTRKGRNLNHGLINTQSRSQWYRHKMTSLQQA